MRYKSAIISLCLVINLKPAISQKFAHSISIFGSFTTTSKLFHHPDDKIESYRNQYLPLNNIFGIGIDYRYNFSPANIQFGLGIEYLKKIEQLTYILYQNKQVTIKDGFITIPFELSGYFRIPIGGENFKPFMGGGVGFYWGQRIYELANVQTQTIHNKFGFGIHIIGGVEYLLISNISLRAEVKFRDVQFGATNKFLQTTTTYDNMIISLPDGPFESYLHIDGMILTFGTVINF